MDKKPNVFPTQEQIAQANDTGEQIANQLAEQEGVQAQYGSEAEAAAAAEMRKRTEEQLKWREEQLRKNEEIAKEMDNKRAQQMTERRVQQPPQQQPPQQPPVVPPTYDGGSEGPSNSGSNSNPYVEALSQPQMNQPFDIIPLPSEGKLYPNKKKNVKVAFMTTADENILTSPNLVESGEFLEILINRKLLEPDLRYKDLLPGDRNAIMLWLRATGYGEMYPIIAYDENDEPFETEVNLSELKTIKLNVEPDSEGLFGYMLPLSKMAIKFKLLTVGDIEQLEELLESRKDNPINEEQTLVLQKQIVEVNGSRNPLEIKSFVENMRVGDAQKLREYINTIECNVDMNLTLRTPGGGSVETFLPITPRFFWPNSRI